MEDVGVAEIDRYRFDAFAGCGWDCSVEVWKGIDTVGEVSLSNAVLEFRAQ